MHSMNDTNKSKLNVKIFATQRIDKKADLYNCDSIIPVRCGAVYDKTDGGGIIGDNTGDNISERRMTFCELTTQYWAWKNVDADYYGFCHYRRYFSFSDKKYPTDGWEAVVESYIDEKTQKKYSIYDDKIEEMLEDCDVLLPNPIKLENVGMKTVIDQYESGVFLDKKHLEMSLDVVKELYPETYENVNEFFHGNKLLLCNMMVMKKELFHEYSKWLFDIIFELEKRIDMTEFSEERRRTLGHIAERLLGAYCYHLERERGIKVKYTQMVTFSSPEKEETLKPVFDEENTARIVLSSSLYYIPFCAATVKSIIDTSSEEHNYDIIVLHTEIPKKIEDMFLEMIKGRKNFSIRFCNVSRVVRNFNLAVCEHFSVETYYRLAIGSFLPDYKKVVYLDSDLIVMKDIYELYSTDVSGYAVAGAVDICLSGINNGYDKRRPRYYKDHVFIKDRNLLKMINAGVLVLNQEFINARYTTKELLTYAQQSNFELCDQDVINSLFQDYILFLPTNWNTPDYEAETLPDWCTKFAPEYLVSGFRAAVKDPYILHYSSTIKPWNEPGYKLAFIFWQTLRDTPFYELVLHRRIVENASYYASVAVPPSRKAKKDRSQKVSLKRRIADKFFPKGTRRRENLKKLVCALTGKKYVEPYYPVK